MASPCTPLWGKGRSITFTAKAPECSGWLRTRPLPRRPWKNSWSKTREDKTGQLIAMKQWANRQVVLVGFLFLAFLLYLAWASSRGDLAIRNTAVARMGEPFSPA